MFFYTRISTYKYIYICIEIDIDIHVHTYVRTYVHRFGAWASRLQETRESPDESFCNFSQGGNGSGFVMRELGLGFRLRRLRA